MCLYGLIWTVIAAATASPSATDPVAGANANAESLLVVEVVPHSDAFDAAQMRSALDTYLEDVAHAFTTMALPADGTEPRWAAAELAKTRAATYVVWWSCRESERRLVIEVHGVRSQGPELVPLNASVDYAKPADAGLYRRAAIKVRSMVRAMMMLAPEPEKIASPAEAVEPEIPDVVIAPASPPAANMAAEARAGLFLVDGGSLVPTLGATVEWNPGPFALGLGAAQLLPQHQNVTTGSASVMTTRLSLGGRYRIVGRQPGDTFFLDGSVGGGAFLTVVRASLVGPPSDKRTVSKASPFLFAGVSAGVAVTRSFEVFVGTTADVWHDSQRFLIHGQVVYTTGWTRIGADLGLRVRF